MEDADLSSRVKRAFRPYRFERAAAEVVHAPQGRRVRRSLLVVVTAIGAVAIWGLNAAPFVGSPAAAFAGWQVTPTPADRGLADAAKDVCLADIPLPAMTLVAQDQRGNAATLLYAGGGELAMCLVLRDSKQDIVAAATGVSHLEAQNGPLSIDTEMTTPKTATAAGLRIVAGRTNASVAAVDVTRADGVVVGATVKDGYFVAWWPSDERTSSLAASDRAGRRLAVVPGLP